MYVELVGRGGVSGDWFGCAGLCGIEQYVAGLGHIVLEWRLD